MAAPSPSEVLNALPDPMEHLKLGPVIGEGAYGKVYQAKLRSTDEIVAVKIVRVSQSQEVR